MPDRMGETSDSTEEYVVHRGTVHWKTRIGIQYEVRWHVDTAADDMWVAAEGFLQTFIDRH